MPHLFVLGHKGILIGGKEPNYISNDTLTSILTHAINSFSPSAIATVMIAGLPQTFLRCQSWCHINAGRWASLEKPDACQTMEEQNQVKEELYFPVMDGKMILIKVLGLYAQKVRLSLKLDMV